MKKLIKNKLLLLLLLVGNLSYGQHEWIGELRLTYLNCDTKQACYTLQIINTQSVFWALGDQNYRLFFDADNAAVLSIRSLLPESHYSAAITNEILEITGQGQEAYSPLDHIDDHLGFLDFSIIAHNKQTPATAAWITNTTFMPIAEICLEVSDDMLVADGEAHSMNLYFSRPATAGMITNQHSLVSEIDAPNHTIATTAVGFSDIVYATGADAQLGKVCGLTSTDDPLAGKVNPALNLFPNPYSLAEKLTYEGETYTAQAHDILIYDTANRLIKTFKDLPAGNTQIVLPKSMATGAYFFQIKSGELTFLEKLIVLE